MLKLKESHYKRIYFFSYVHYLETKNAGNNACLLRKIKDSGNIKKIFFNVISVKNDFHRFLYIRNTAQYNHHIYSIVLLQLDTPLLSLHVHPSTILNTNHFTYRKDDLILLTRFVEQLASLVFVVSRFSPNNFKFIETSVETITDENSLT